MGNHSRSRRSGVRGAARLGLAPEVRVVESLDNEWLGWDHLDNSGITRLDFSWGIFDFLTGSSIDFLEHFIESASDVRGMAIEDWGVTFLDFTRVVQDDDLGVERFGFEGWVLFGVGANVTSSDVFDGDILDVETDVVAWETFWDLGVVHLDGFDLSGDVGWSEFDDHTGFWYRFRLGRLAQFQYHRSCRRLGVGVGELCRMVEMAR